MNTQKLFLAAVTFALSQPALAMMDGPKLIGKPQSAREWDYPTVTEKELVGYFRRNHIPEVRYLIRAAGANQESPIRVKVQNQKSCLGDTAGSLLINAILEKNTDMARALIEEGANCNVRCYQGDALKIAYVQDEPALVLAAERNMTSVCKLLLERGADANAQTNDGETALAWAAENKNEELVDLLFNKYKAKFVPHLKKKKPCCPSSCSIQ